MAIRITQACINCGACEPECPNSAIYEWGMGWELGGKVYKKNEPSPSGAKGFFSDECFYIVPDKCTECVGYFEEPQCAAICPVDCCIPDLNHVENRESLLDKKSKLEKLNISTKG